MYQALMSLLRRNFQLKILLNKMRKTKDAKSLSIYLPNEISPEAVFGKTTIDLNKQKADLLSSVNKSISEHKKVLLKLHDGDFKNKNERK